MFRLFLTILLLTWTVPAYSADNPLPEYENQARTLWNEAEQIEKKATAPFEVREELGKIQTQADEILNKAYREVMKNLKNADPALADLLKNEQRTWLKFTESFCSKAQDHFGEGGTMYINSALYAKLRLWIERIAWLRILNRQLVFEE